MVVEIKVTTDLCPECGGNAIPIHERGEIVCMHCGLVIGERGLDISHNGTRAYTKQEKAKRNSTGSPISILLPDISLTTVIDRAKINNPDLRRAVKWNSHLSWEKRNILIAITELKRIGSNLNFPEHVKKATISLYKKVFKKQLLRGRSIYGMITACAYFICKEVQFPITFQEILDEAAAGSNIVKKSYKILLNELNLKSYYMDPISFIPRFCAELKLSIDIERESIMLLEKFLIDSFISGKDPKGFCAGAIYLISKLKGVQITQKKIAKVVGVTEVTLRSRYKELLKSYIINYLNSERKISKSPLDS